MSSASSPPTAPCCRSLRRSYRRTGPADKVLVEDVQVQFGTKVLPMKMTLWRLVDELSFVEDTHELTYNTNRVAARL